MENKAPAMLCSYRSRTTSDSHGNGKITPIEYMMGMVSIGQSGYVRERSLNDSNLTIAIS